MQFPLLGPATSLCAFSRSTCTPQPHSSACRTSSSSTLQPCRPPGHVPSRLVGATACHTRKLRPALQDLPHQPRQRGHAPGHRCPHLPARTRRHSRSHPERGLQQQRRVARSQLCPRDDPRLQVCAWCMLPAAWPTGACRVTTTNHQSVLLNLSSCVLIGALIHLCCLLPAPTSFLPPNPQKHAVSHACAMKADRCSSLQAGPAFDTLLQSMVCYTLGDLLKATSNQALMAPIPMVCRLPTVPSEAAVQRMATDAPSRTTRPLKVAAVGRLRPAGLLKGCIPGSAAAAAAVNMYTGVAGEALGLTGCKPCSAPTVCTEC